jgi:hypothetical protein
MPIGRYVLCGLGGSRAIYVFASKGGYSPVNLLTVHLNGNTIRDIEMQH